MSIYTIINNFILYILLLIIFTFLILIIFLSFYPVTIYEMITRSKSDNTVSSLLKKFAMTENKLVTIFLNDSLIVKDNVNFNFDFDQNLFSTQYRGIDYTFNLDSDFQKILPLYLTKNL